ncbi:hypothetical protein [Enhygromyxa salina]|uniref:Uncharacterized protein n=1 Tax=Enhygromyxa salina TaxID=215803 RepID=A0A2S9XPN7_9BACT|nr:hypothetical protein [Enhygromyxa salina]PRP94823.1 hypothetical protein ENSA7_76460 [Enhygromyxa salina]
MELGPLNPVDAHSGAFVGIDVRDHEDSDALISAYEEGKQATSNVDTGSDEAMKVDVEVERGVGALNEGQRAELSVLDRRLPGSANYS